MSKSLRDEMPLVAAWIDSLREVFGRETIDQQIRRGLRGEPTFFACEGGHRIGTPRWPRSEVRWDARGISYVIEVKGDEHG